MSDDCLFCSIVSGDVPSDTVAESDHAVAFRDVNPQAPTHVLVIPRVHQPDIGSLAAAEPEATIDLLGAGTTCRRRRGRLLPPGVQHRRRGEPDGVPLPRARAGRSIDELAAGLTHVCDALMNAVTSSATRSGCSHSTR